MYSKIVLGGLLLQLFFIDVTICQVKYPDTKKSTQSDMYFGTKVDDPYRWLEDDNSEDTKAWVVAQNAVTQSYLSKIPFREKVKNRLSDMWNYERYGTPFPKGEYLYYSKNDGLQNQSVIYRQKGLAGVPEVFLDPNKLSSDGTAALGALSFNNTAKYMAYTIAQSGSDWQEVYVMDVNSRSLISDKLDFIKFSGITWRGAEGFYYSRYPVPDEKSKLSKQNENHKVYFHKIGTPQSADEIIYEDKANPKRLISASLTEDERFLIVSKTEGTSGRELWVKDLKTAGGEFKLLVKGYQNEASAIINDGDRILVRTNINAPNYHVVSIDPNNASEDKWQVIIPARTKLLANVSTAGGKLLLNYLEDATSRIYQTSYKGILEHTLALPGMGTISGFSGRKEDKEVYYSFVSYNTPAMIMRYNVDTRKTNLFKKTKVKINPDDYLTTQVFFTSKDGANVPMFITYKKGMVLHGNNPVLLYGYGGFNIAMTPGFSISNAFFLEQGGVYAVVNLRGGNEYGEEWHKAGMLMKKQNVFNDFIGAAEWLIEKKYTKPSKLAIMGGSNGGLLVGAVMTQRPELFQVALPAVGVLDMLRYHLFTIGYAWATEYGRSDKKEDFANLYKYSPLHNLKKGVKYPATLITTADHDDRVVPAHSFKFAAKLQDQNDGTNPTLIRIETKAGHGAGKPVSKQIEEAADVWSFLMYNLGVTFR